MNMQVKTLQRYIKKFITLGPKKSFIVLENRVKNALNHSYLKHKALNKKVASSWADIVKSHDIDHDFNLFWQKQLQKSTKFIDHSLFAYHDTEKLMQDADMHVKNGFNLLGSGACYFDTIPWHDDFRLHAQNPDADYRFDGNAYYKEVRSNNDTTNGFKKDIKIPWELSRFQHLYPLAIAYQKTGDKKYVDTIITQIEDWIEKNPYLLGPNWVCPMDVGLRAVNWIWAFVLLKDSGALPIDFCQKVTCSLYDHVLYLESNWEIFDTRTSNHYLSDLVGYFYLCYFFSDLPCFEEKTNWCYQEICAEFEKQVFQDGTDYEGSTAYHKLVTELFYHAFILAESNLGFIIPEEIQKKLQRMINVLDWCSYTSNKFIKIGDDDSGKVLYPSITAEHIATLKSEPVKTDMMHFSEFGLSIIKTDQWHISMRHHAYTNRQPSGHFHNDQASVTVAVDGNPLFVDPGSYIYTPSASWRNRFRSATVHNTFSLDGKEPVALEADRLFALDMPEGHAEFHPLKSTDEYTLESNYSLYYQQGVDAYRTVTLNKTAQKMVITDTWLPAKKNHDAEHATFWNFTLDAHVMAEKQGNTIILSIGSKQIAQLLAEELNFYLESGWISPAYGVKQKTTHIRARAKVKLNQKIQIILERIS